MDHPSYESLKEGKRVSASLWDNSGAWATCAKALGDHDEDMIRNWKEEIDTLLVLAGLFSAVVTTFNVEVYTMLQPQPEDMMVATLMQISTQLNSFVLNSNFVNSTQPMDSKTLSRPFKADAVAIRLNIAWFLALVCGLLSASLGLLVKQWLREYLSGSSNVSRESMRIRQLRYESLRRWRVPEIILFLPILLQVGLLLFFVGLLDLLWTLHPIVAAVITTFVSIAMAIATVMAILPPFFADCPYKSPQSWFVFSLIQSVKRIAISVAVPYYAHLRCGDRDPELSSNLRDIPALIRDRFSRTMRGWLRQLTLHHTFSSWKERERASVKNAAPAVDDAILSGADAIFMDDSFLHNVIRPCLDDIQPNNALRCLDRILLQRAPSIIHGFPYWDFALSTGDRGTIALLDPLLDVLHRLNQLESDHEDVDESRRRVLVTMHRIVRAIPGPTVSQPHDKQTCALLRRTFEILAGVINPAPAHAIASPVVRERAFHLMLKLFPRFQSVGTTCILALCAYSIAMRRDNSPYRFVQACNMAIRATAFIAHRVQPAAPSKLDPHKDEPPPFPSPYTISEGPYSPATTVDPNKDNATSEYLSIRPTITRLLGDLEDFLSLPLARAPSCRPTMSMLAECTQALVALAARDRRAVSLDLVHAIRDVITDALGDATEAASLSDEEGGGEEYHALVAKQAVRVLGRIYHLELSCKVSSVT